MDFNCNCNNWFYTVLALIGLFFTWSLVIFNYYLKVSRKSIELGNQSKEHENKHNNNCQRIEKLEEKNGKELKEIERLNSKVEILEGVIKTITETKQKN